MTATRGLTSHVPVGDRSKGAPMMGVDIVGMVRATRAGTASGYLITGPERIRRREHIVDMPSPRSACQQRGRLALYAMYLISLK
jgi:hypothetical protein